VRVHSVHIISRAIGVADSLAVNSFAIKMAAADFTQAVMGMGDILFAHLDRTAFHGCLRW
jgi:hypothetical protein